MSQVLVCEAAINKIKIKMPEGIHIPSTVS